MWLLLLTTSRGLRPSKYTISCNQAPSCKNVHYKDYICSVVGGFHELLYKNKFHVFTQVHPLWKSHRGLPGSPQASSCLPQPLWPDLLGSPLLHCSLCSSHTWLRVLRLNVQVISCLRTFALIGSFLGRLEPHIFKTPASKSPCGKFQTPPPHPWQITSSYLYYFFSLAFITIILYNWHFISFIL